MAISNEMVSTMTIDYTEIIEIIKAEKTIRLKTIANVIQSLFDEAQSNNFSMYDEEGNVSYRLTYQSKLRTLADFFSDESFLYEGTSDDFHNLAVDYARNNMYSEACIVLERGIALRPSSIDLLADYLLYGKQISAKRAQCRKNYESLMAIPRSMWNWRAYSFLIDYLLEERYYSSSQEAETAIRTECLTIAQEYIRRYSGNDLEKDNTVSDKVDRAFSDLAGIYGAFGEYDKEKSTLKNCADTYKKVPVSSLRLADIEFSSGNYADAAYYLSKCVAAMDPQPTIRQGYVYLLRAYSNASILFTEQTNRSDNLISTEQRKDLVSTIKKDLNTAEALLGNSNNEYRTSIETLRRILEMQCDEEDASIIEDWS